MDLIEVRELRYFLALAEELHFGRAAQRLHLAQPALSKAIRQLEAKLGVPLVHRTTRSVALTAEGEALLQHGRVALNAVGAAAHRARRAGSAALVLTAKSSDALVASEIAARCAEMEPELAAPRVTISGWGEQTAMLREGRADAAIVRMPFDPAGLRVRTLRTEPRLAVLSAKHPLAGRKRLRLSELTDEPRPTWPGADRMTNAYWTATEDGPPAPEGPTVSDLAQLLEVVALGQAIAFLPVSIADRNRRSDVVYVPVTGVTLSTVAIAWPEHANSHPLRALLRAARNVAESPGAEFALANGAGQHTLASG
jgi:DNA-binding transcriptional LysR family regulator